MGGKIEVFSREQRSSYLKKWVNLGERFGALDPREGRGNPLGAATGTET